MAMITKIGYGQVEPNHLSAQRTGQIYAQTPVEDGIEVVENGMFLKLDSEAGVLNGTGNGEWMLVFNEVKLYENHKQGYKDFALLKEEAVGGVIVPRVFKTNIGDIYTTNMAEDVAVGVALEPSEAGLVPFVEGPMKFEVLKVYTMPDGQKAVKVVRVA